MRLPHKTYARLVAQYQKHLDDAASVESKILALLNLLSSEDAKDHRFFDNKVDPAWIPPYFAPTLDAELAQHEQADERES